ncbi:MAG: hypothetical protein ACREA9_21770 [Pyrinomonadaceae bacterium]
MIRVLDHGFARLVDYMGDDLSIVRAARISYELSARYKKLPQEFYVPVVSAFGG